MFNDMQYFYALIIAVLSYIVCELLTHPKSKIWKKLPQVKVRRLELFPSIRVQIKGHIIHFHHWFNYSVLLGVSVFVSSSFLDSWITRGFLTGAVIQGLLTPSARKLIYKEEWFRKMIE
jgi:hypothetical protein